MRLSDNTGFRATQLASIHFIYRILISRRAFRSRSRALSILCAAKPQHNRLTIDTMQRHLHPHTIPVLIHLIILFLIFQPF